MSKKLLLRLVVLMTVMMCSLGASAQEAYACHTWSNLTLTFYYDTERNSRTGTTFDLNTGPYLPSWLAKVIYRVVFDPSFANARPTTTYGWFFDLGDLECIIGMNYLNTSEVTDMTAMFANCSLLQSLDVSHFNTSKVTNMDSMFGACWELTSLDLSSFNTSKVTNMTSMFVGNSKLRTIYVGNGWSTDAVTNSTDMFYGCTRLVGGKGTTWNESNPMDKTYAHIDGGPSNPGYFTAHNSDLRGDVDGDGSVNISDVTALIDILLRGETAPQTADANQDSIIDINDVTALIDYLLSGAWN